LSLPRIPRPGGLLPKGITVSGQLVVTVQNHQPGMMPGQQGSTAVCLKKRDGS